MSDPDRRHLALMLPSDNGYIPCLGMVDLLGGKVVTTGVPDVHLPVWIEAIEAVRRELGMRALMLGKVQPKEAAVGV